MPKTTALEEIVQKISPHTRIRLDSILCVEFNGLNYDTYVYLSGGQVVIFKSGTHDQEIAGLQRLLDYQ